MISSPGAGPLHRSSNTALLPPGEVLAGRFRVEAMAGRGGMGTIYRAQDLSNGRTVALKLLATDPSLENLRPFSREAEMLASLSHPGIVSHVAHGMTQEPIFSFIRSLVQAKTALARGELAEAEAHARKACEQPFPCYLLLARTVLSVVLRAQGRLAEARQCAALGCEELERMGGAGAAAVGMYPDAALRKRFLQEVPENARTLLPARQLGKD